MSCLRNNLSKNDDDNESLSTVEDPYIKSKVVPALTLTNYHPHLGSKDIGIVMFYILGDQSCNWSRRHYKKAAENTTKSNNTFAAVDCVQEFELCIYEEVKHFPYFKLYAKGKEVGIRQDPKSFLYKDMRSFIERYPYGNAE